VNAFPVRTAEEFVEFLRAIYASGPNAPKPSPLDSFLGAHPAALEFVQLPKAMPASFATLAYFAVSAYKFINGDGAGRFGRYSIQPAVRSEYLGSPFEGQAPPNFLFEEISTRLARGPVTMRLVVQLAAKEDIVDDSTVQWPSGRPEVVLGTLELRSVLPNNAEEQRQIIFDPIPRVDGIEASADPLLEPRADVYLMSGRRRRSAGASATYGRS